MSEDTATSSEEAIDQLIVCAFDCTEQNVKRCRKCNRSFCIMHCNHFSPNFCKDCFKDLSIVADKFKRTFDYIGDNGQLFVHTEQRIRYYMDGMDWPFVTPWIDGLSDEELKIIWVFHHYIMRLIETENDTRNVERNRKLREHVVPKLITGTTTKTRSVTKMAQPDTPETLKAKWLKQGLPLATVEIMLKAMETKP